MRHALVAAILPLVLAAPAFAQGTLEQPKNPDDGVGVDYTQPYLNDLLLRAYPFVDGNSIANSNRKFACEKQRMALAEDPLDPALDQAYEACLKRQREQSSTSPPRATPAPGPGARPPLYIPDPDGTAPVRPLPPAPAHPNAQN